MKTSHRPASAKLAFIGIGNPIAGDDAAGIMVVRNLQRGVGMRNDLLFYELTGDLLEMADLLSKAPRFIFCDALQGADPGKIQIIPDSAARSFSPSFHQTDIASVMHSLKSLRMIMPFPEWEIWGISIAAPTHFSEDITPPVAHAIHTCVSLLSSRIESMIMAIGRDLHDRPKAGNKSR
jgi:hydrogenase maturation protease